jgi:hypothetical protein
MKSFFRFLMRRGAAAIARQLTLQEAWEEFLVLQGMQAALLLRGQGCLESLQDAEFKVFSQWGEDGIIEWLVSRLPGIPQSFVEFGVEDYIEANTRFLLSHRNWRGLVMDGNPANVAKIQSRSGRWRNDLTAISAFITRENINELIGGAGFTGEIGLLSIDIDGNDYWVWKAISVVSPWIVIVEYNCVLGDLSPLTIPYDAGFRRMQAHRSGLYYGASAPALEQLASRLGYTLVGGNRAGNNMFFVRNDAMAVLGLKIGDRRVRSSLYTEARDDQGDLSFVRGIMRRDLIKDMLVTNLDSGVTASLADMGELYSPYWIAIQQGKPLPRPYPA